jgi:lipopolysaccharide export system permease protein
LKQVDKLVIGSFIGPYILSFFVAEFVLVMQFLWKYIDDIIGKGFSLYMLLEMIFYYAMTIVPLAVPVTVLIASVMVFGNMSERFELSSFKSAGVSLTRVMRGGILIAIFTGGFSLFASNYLKPKANFKFNQRFYSIRKQKPTLSIEEGIFNKDFKNYIIRVGSKNPDGKRIEDILIYDHTGPNPEEISVIIAKSGEMYTTEDGNFFVMNLYDGKQYRDLRKNVLTQKEKKEGKKVKSKYPFLRTHFKEWTKIFDMGEFEFNENNPSLDRNKKDLMNTAQILYSIDSLDQRIVESTNDNGYRFDTMFDTLMAGRQKSKSSRASKYEKYNKIATIQSDTIINLKKQTPIADSLIQNVKSKKLKKSTKRLTSSFKQNSTFVLDSLNHFGESFKISASKKYIAGALAAAKATRDRVKTIILKNNNYKHTRSRYVLKLNQQYSWALVCIIFLFIGAPLGSIIRKGGYGYPLLISIIFFMIFIILQIMGDKLNRSDKMDPFLGAWLPCLVLLPVAIFLTRKALNDSKVFNLAYYTNKLFARFINK